MQDLFFSSKELYVLPQYSYSKITSGANFSLRYLVLRSFKCYEIVKYDYFTLVTYLQNTRNIYLSSGHCERNNVF